MSRPATVGLNASHWRSTIALLVLVITLPTARAGAKEFDTCRIRGTVTDVAGKALPGAKVSLNRSVGAEHAPDNKYEAITDAAGNYEIAVRFARGKTLVVCEIFADLPGYVRSAPPLMLPLKNGAQGTVDFRLTAGVLLAGEVRLPLEPWERGRSPESIVRVLEVSNPTFDTLTLNARCHLLKADGKFTVYVPPGDYTLRIVNDSELPAWKDIHAPSDNLVLELPPFAWTEKDVGRVYDELWHAMDHRYSYFFLKPDVDWQALGQQHRPKILRSKNAEELAAALRDLLAPLRDMHVWIQTPTGIVPTLKGGYTYNGNRQVTLAELQETTACGQFAIVGQTKRDGYGYLLMLRQSEATPAAVQLAVAAIRKLNDVPGFIVDLRMANGGSEPLAMEIAKLFCAAPTVYAKSKYRNGANHDDFGQTYERVLPAGDDPFIKPVVCLIGPGAVSSGEGFVKMMKYLPQVTTVGTATRGASGNPQPLRLSRTGLTVYFSRWVDMLPDGQSIEGVGIAPDIRVDAAPSAYVAADPTLEKGLEILRARIASSQN